MYFVWDILKQVLTSFYEFLVLVIYKAVKRSNKDGFSG
jgi:hypothetical protein